MPLNEELSLDDELQLAKGGGLKKRTIEDRRRDFNYFQQYFEETNKTDYDMATMLTTEVGRQMFADILGRFFYTMRVEGGNWPKKGNNKMFSEMCNLLKHLMYFPSRLRTENKERH